MKIEDDFLGQEDFVTLQSFMLGHNDVHHSIYWFYNDSIDRKDDIDRFQFTYLFYVYYYPNNIPNAHFNIAISILDPIMEKIKAVSLWRIKANLLTRTPNIIENSFHVDMDKVSEEKLKQWTTAIFYVNTNNGYTEFEDGTKVESVANRMVTFPANLKHRGTSCTDENTRVVINFNYFKS